MTGKGKQNHIFQKSKSYEISSTVIYISKDQKCIIHVFYWCIPLNHEIYTKCKNHLTWLIKGISSHKICSGVKSQQEKKKLSFSTKKLLIFLRIALFHFIESLSTMYLFIYFQFIYR